MLKLILTLLLVSKGYSLVMLPSMNITLPSAQVTPRGFDNPLFNPVTSTLLIEDSHIPASDYKGVVLMAVAVGQGFPDDIIFRRMDYGCAGTILMGWSYIYPGSSVQKMRNAKSFYLPNGNIYPVVDMTIPMFTNLTDILNATTFFGPRIPLEVTITAELNDNVWKLLGLNPLYRALQIINGILSLFFIVWSIRILQLIVQGGLAKKAIVPLVSNVSIYLHVV